VEGRTQIWTALIGAGATIVAAAITVNAVRDQSGPSKDNWQNNRAEVFENDNKSDVVDDMGNATIVTNTADMTATTTNTVDTNMAANIAPEPIPTVMPERPVRYWNDCRRSARLWLVHYDSGGWDDNGRLYWEVPPYNDKILARNGADVKAASDRIYLFAADPNDDYEWAGTATYANWERLREFNMEIDSAGNYLIRLNCPESG
jgi:hypothetical protein